MARRETDVSTGSPRLRTDRFELRLAKESDLPQLLAYRRENADHLEPFEPVRSSDHFTEAYWKRQVQCDREQFETGVAVRLYIFEPGPKPAVIGLVAFSNIIRGPFQSCFLGYALAESRQGRGLMTEALRLGIDYMFGEMHLHRISANHLPDNTRSAAVLKRLGFAVDGYARDYLMIGGRWQDHILTSLLNPAWVPPPE
jgi:[ribosomal protein S5]-alanine N-acetyltransferase